MPTTHLKLAISVVIFGCEFCCGLVHLIVTAEGKNNGNE